MLKFKIKICGITNPSDAIAAHSFGADAIGLNFYNRSLRSVPIEKAAEIVAVVPNELAIVGVFVNETNAEINRIAKQLNLDYVQLHGDEASDMMGSIDFPTIRAIRIENDAVSDGVEEAANWTAAGAAAVLLDTASKSQYGGTGIQLRWGIVSELRLDSPLILAGGLTCENVAEAIMQVRPAAVDVASGIEKFPGVKDHDQMRRFVEAARSANATD